MRTGIIYKITSSHTDRVYIGSTFKMKDVRLYEHIQQYERYIAGISKYCCTSRELLRYLPDCDVSVVKIGKYNSKQDLEQDERMVILNTPLTVNKNIPRGTSGAPVYSPSAYHYRCSWGGDPRFGNNLLHIAGDVFG